ncbi:hypothetical protein [Conyzicola sp.]|uniref:hypothetical protein n=1 Tax=Conyzicola sp. TaxID=1969404 RepID=UPI00398A079A
MLDADVHWLESLKNSAAVLQIEADPALVIVAESDLERFDTADEFYRRYIRSSRTAVSLHNKIFAPTPLRRRK